MYTLVLVFIMNSYNAVSSLAIPRVGTYQQCMDEGAKQAATYTRKDSRGNIAEVMYSCVRVQ